MHPNTYTGKIGRCSLRIREQVNHRLLDGEPATTLLAWLNAEGEVQAMLTKYFDAAPITPQNLSEWRKGGYSHWLQQRDRVARLKELSGYAAQLSEAVGGHPTDGSAAIIGGRILERIEQALDSEDDDTLSALIDPLIKLRGTDLHARKLRQAERALDQKERALVLDEQRFQVRSCELFLQWAKDKRALDIAASSAAPTMQIAQLRTLIFGPVITEEVP